MEREERLGPLDQLDPETILACAGCSTPSA